MKRVIAVVAVGVALAVQSLGAQPASTFETWTVADSWAARVANWRLMGNLALGLTIGIAFLGMVVAALQAPKKRSSKVAAAVLGAVITFLAVVNSEAFDVGHRAYRRAADAAESKVELVRWWIRPYADVEERKEAIAIVRGLLAELNAISQRLNSEAAVATGSAPESQSSWLSDPIPRIFAQTRQSTPAWTRGRAPESDRIYFVGVGLDSSLSVAKRVSRDNALTAVREDLASRLPTGHSFNVEALSDYLAESVVTVETYFERDAKSSQYRYYSLVALSKTAIETDASLFGFRENVTVPAEAVRAAQGVQASSIDYQIKRQELYGTLSKNAQSQVPPDVYRTYEAARTKRLSGDPRGAVAPLEDVVKRAPTFFMAWYNLALAGSAAGERAKAEEAYKRASELEPSQSVREPSVYNSYGHFLLEQGRGDEAVPVLKRALSIDPKHPMANRNLEVAKMTKIQK